MDAAPLQCRVHERPIQSGDPGASQQVQRPLYVGAQDFERAADARLARRGEAVGIGAAHQHRTGAEAERLHDVAAETDPDRKSTRLNSSHSQISYAVFCLKKKNYIYASFYRTFILSHS